MTGRLAVGLACALAAALVGSRAGATNGDRLPASVTSAERTGRPAASVADPEFAANDPLLPLQWYVPAGRVLAAWASPPTLPRVRVAIIDSGVDLGHPDLAGRVIEARSFVGGSAADRTGHGTIVAGLIAAGIDNGIGIVGLAPSAELLVARVVTNGLTIPLRAEAKAIRWAVDRGAQVINMSFGGLRDPTDASRDTYSQIEADAIRYAVSKGVVVVAAVGNGDDAPRQPWPYASYPAALPHVLGVGALTRKGGVPPYSNQDAVLTDIVAPGVDIVSTFPRSLTAKRPACEEQGYTLCATPEFEDVSGTSFAAPQVTAAVANLLAVAPTLTADQAIAVLVRAARDLGPEGACRRCAAGHDAPSGYGRLDGAAALAGAIAAPPPDTLEPNDDAGAGARRLSGLGPIEATLDRYDDRNDVYAVRLRKGDRLGVQLTSSNATSVAVLTPAVSSLADLHKRPALILARSRSRREHDFTSGSAPLAGWYGVRVQLTAGGRASYRLELTPG